MTGQHGRRNVREKPPHREPSIGDLLNSLLPLFYNFITMRIGNLTPANPFFLAPMAGYTDISFRSIMKAHGCGLVSGEMISADGLVYNNEHNLKQVISNAQEMPVSFQIFGSDPLTMAKAAEMVEKSGASIVDINMGCPAKKIVRSGAGAALLLDLPRVRKIFSEVKRSISCPLTVKVRSGWSPRETVVYDVVTLAEDMGVDAITIHPRSAKQGFSGRAEWDIIKEAKKRVSIPVIGNGDITQPADAIRMMDMTDCDAVMIGRASLGNPWIFSQIIELTNGAEPRPVTLDDRYEAALLHFQLLQKYCTPHQAVRKICGQVMLYVKGLPFCSDFRRTIQQVRDSSEFITEFEKYFSTVKRSSRSYEG